MPKYYFDVLNAGELSRDTFGIDLADDEEAREQTLGLVSCLARDLLGDRDGHDLRVTARNARGDTVYEADLSLNGSWRTGRSR